VQSLSDPLNLLHEDGSWFARAHEVHLWVVHSDANLRKPVCTLLPKFEFHHDNDRAWVVLAEAHTAADDGWQLRANNLAAAWEQRVAAFAEEGIDMRPVVAQHGPTGLGAFALTVGAVLAALCEPLAGIVVVLTPGTVEDVEALEAELFELVGRPELKACRWVLALDSDVAPPGKLLDALGPDRWMVTTCVVDDAQQRRDFSAMLGGSDPARFGTAWPVGVVPPARVDDPPPLPIEVRDAALREEGIDPALLEQAPEIRAKVLGAAIAMKEGRGEQAIEMQSQACRLCAGLGLFELHVITRVGLASYLSGLDQRPVAKIQIREAIEVARTHDLPRPESQAHLALGLLCSLDGEYEDAVGAYTDAARSAEAGEEPQLAIEGWRMAGQLAIQLRQDQAAVDAFGEALRVAEGTPPEQLRDSSAAEVARRLASVYERHGMPAQAQSLHEQADAFEAGTPTDEGEKPGEVHDVSK